MASGILAKAPSGVGVAEVMCYLIQHIPAMATEIGHHLAAVLEAELKKQLEMETLTKDKHSS